MKKLLFLLLMIVFISGCSNKDELTGNEKVTTVEKESATDLESELINASAEIFSYLQNEDFAKLAEKVDPVEGITFSLFADFGNANGYGGKYVNLSKDEIVSSADLQFVWGYDDSDKVFEMTLREYIQEILLKLYGKVNSYETITFNEQEYGYGGVFNTIHENYPDAKYVEYFSALEEGNVYSYQSIRFVFQERNNIWYLIGIARDVTTG